jgi:hypothetical protein
MPNEQTKVSRCPNTYFGARKHAQREVAKKALAMKSRILIHQGRSGSARWVSLLVSCALLLSPLSVGFGRSPISTGSVGQARQGRPEAGPPAATMPNLDEVRRRRDPKPQAPPHIPSTIRSRQKPLLPRNGRRVGDPLPRVIGSNGTAGNLYVELPQDQIRNSSNSERAHD